MLGFLAKECGWNYKWVAENLTLSQIKRYYETISEAKKAEHARMVEGVFHATAAAMGNIKTEDFNKYLNIFYDAPKKTAKEIINEMKMSDLPIEEN